MEKSLFLKTIESKCGVVEWRREDNAVQRGWQGFFKNLDLATGNAPIPAIRQSVDSAIFRFQASKGTAGNYVSAFFNFFEDCRGEIQFLMTNALMADYVSSAGPIVRPSAGLPALP